MAFEGFAESARRVHERPRLLVLGALVAVAELATVAAVSTGAILTDATGWATLPWIVLQRLLLIVALGALLPGLYAAVRGDLRSFLGGVRSSRRPLGAALAAHLAGLVVAAGAAAFLLADALALDTVLAVGLRATGAGTVPREPLAGLVVLLLAGVPFLVRVPLSFADLLVIDGDATARGGWLTSGRAAFSRPRAVAGYAVVAACLLVVPVLLAVGAMAVAQGIVAGPDADVTPAALLAGAVAFLFATAITRPSLAMYHVVFYERVVAGGAADRLVDRSVDRRALVAAAILVLAAIAGVGAVRVADAGPDRSPSPPAIVGGDNATAALRAAYARTTARDRRITYRSEQYNATTDRWRRTITARYAIDHDRRAVRGTVSFSMEGGTQTVTLYSTDGMTATRNGTEPGMGNPFAVQYERGAWTVTVGAPYAGTESLASLPDPTLDWRVVDRTDERIVYGIDDPEQLQHLDGLYYPAPDSERVRYLGKNYARITVDRQTGYVRSVSKRAAFVRIDEDGNETIRSRTQTEFHRIGRATVRRPPSLGPRGPLELLWDAIYY